MDDELPNGSMKDYLLWLVRLRRRFHVSGTSMLPLLKPGDEVLIDPRAYRQAAPCLDDVVIARHPYKNDVRIIKRVVEALENNRYRLAGDNATQSTDSRSFGAVPLDYILGKVVSRFP